MTNQTFPLTLPALVRWAAETYGSRAAIKEDGTLISYEELAVRSRRAAAAFMAAGIEQGDRVAIWAPNMHEWIEAAIGLQSAGAVLVPLNNRLQGAEAADILLRSGAKMLLTVTALEKGEPLSMLTAEDLPALTGTVLLRGEDPRAASWQAFLAAGDGVERQAVEARASAFGPDDTADMLFTSGTTGKPKGVLSSHQQNIRVFKSWGETVGLRSDDNYLIINPFFHTFGYKAGWLASIIFGSTTLPVMVFDKEAAMAQIERDQVTMLPGAPSLYEMLLADPARDKYDLSSLRLGVTGAAAVPVQLVKDMRSVLGFETVVTAYGLTESTGVVSICRPDDDAETIATTSGRAIDGVEVKCANPDTGEEVSRGSEGEIWVRGYNVMQGYFDMPEATAETITAEGWLRTGDIGVMDDKGYLRITDRLKDMYIMNGENVYPAEVEKALYGLDGVAQVAVIGVPRQQQGEVGMAFVVQKAGAALMREHIVDYCGEHLARYKSPFYVQFVESLPLNAAGKVVKPELKKLAADLLRAGC
jgi:acyl-CoA synthetase (AMP-forming)/AMP-acid ligase II